MATIGEVFIDIKADASSFKRTTAGLEATAGNAGKAGGKKFGGGLLAATKAAAGPIAAVLAAAGGGKFLVDAVQQAGNFQQSVGAIEAVFKGSSAEMKKWSKEAAKSVGLSANEFNELGTLIGSQLKNGGTAMSELAPKTKELINLGADLSSMFGGTTKDAVNAISSALKGERDPIERYGVSLKQASIDAKAAEMGFKKVGSTFDNQAQQAATMALIMEQSKDATGNFAKESDTLQGKQQRLAASWANAKTALGMKLLPYVVKFTDFMAKNLPVAIDFIKQKMVQFRPVIDYMAEQWKKLSGQFQVFWAEHGPMVKKIFVGLAAVLGGAMLLSLLYVWKMLSSVIWTLDKIFDFLEAIDTPKKFFNGFVSGLKGIAGLLYKVFLKPFVDAFVFFAKVPRMMFNLGVNMGRGLIDGIKRFAKSIYEWIVSPIRNGVNAVKKYLKIKSPSRVMAEIGANTMRGFEMGVNKNSALPRDSIVSSINSALDAVNGLQSGSMAVTAASGASTGSVKNVTINVDTDNESLIDKIMDALDTAELATGSIGF